MIHDDKPSLDELMHHGVKGQKWGVRKHQETRGQYKQRVRKERGKYYQDKASHLYKEASKDPNVLVKLRTRDGVTHIVTGKEFVNHLHAGGYMDVKMSDIYARQTSKNGPYELQPSYRYQKSARR